MTHPDTLHETEGDTFSKTIKFTDNTDSDVDISGWTLYVTVKENLSDADPDAILSEDITTHDDAIAGETSFSFSSTKTEGLEGPYWFEIKYKDDDGDVETIVSRVIEFGKAVRESV